jgi:hypothetical protein
LTQFTDVDNYSTESVITNLTQDYRGTTGFAYTTSPLSYGSFGTASGTLQYSVSSSITSPFQVSQVMTGNINVALTTVFDSATPSGTNQFILSNVVRSLGQPTPQNQINFTPNTISFDASDAIFSYGVTNTAATNVINQNQITLGTKGSAVITANSSQINVSTDYSTADVSGTNTDGTPLAPVTLTGLYFTTAAYNERGTPY